jgi:hypothetical protein
MTFKNDSAWSSPVVQGKSAGRKRRQTIRQEVEILRLPGQYEVTR